MPGFLVDTNVWIAAVFTSHPFHDEARNLLEEATPALPAIFCRATQQSFLRLASSPVILKAYGVEGFSNRDALVAFDALAALSQVCEREEPPGTIALWRRLASDKTAAPKLWMDAYLAAFAIEGALRMVTFDRDFKKFEARGLNLLLVSR